MQLAFFELAHDALDFSLSFRTDAACHCKTLGWLGLWRLAPLIRGVQLRRISARYIHSNIGLECSRMLASRHI